MKKLYTFLGVNNYTECVYQSMDTGWESSPTKFVQVAILEMLSLRGIVPDEVVVFLTKTAREKNWGDQVMPSGERVFGLHSVLKDKFGEDAFGIKVVEIPEEQVEDALWELFEKIAEEIGEGDCIYLDITYSFRSIPAISLIISNYMRVLKKMKLGGLFYGGFIPGQRKIPMYDLTEMLALFEWTQAVDDFLRTGSAKMLVEVIGDRQIVKKEDDQLFKLAQQLNEVSMTIETCRGQMVNEAIKKARMQLCLLQENTSPRFKPFQKLLDRIEHKLEEYRPGEVDTNILFIVHWCLDHQLYQQGYTFLQEGILTILAEDAGLPSDHYNNRKLIQSVIYALTGQGNMSVEKLKPQQQALLEKWKPLAEFLKFYPVLTDYRNNINHSQALEDKYDHNQVVHKLEEFLEDTKRFIVHLRSMAK